jgi:hypothetical protein
MTAITPEVFFICYKIINKWQTLEHRRSIILSYINQALYCKGRPSPSNTHQEPELTNLIYYRKQYLLNHSYSFTPEVLALNTIHVYSHSLHYRDYFYLEVYV